MQQKNSINIRTLALVGVLSALVLALSLIEIRIPLALGESTRLHLGNVMCLLSGVLFGPLVGGLASGLGSMFYDFTNPLYAPEFWLTFIMKFCLGFFAGLFARWLHALPVLLRNLVAALGGQLVYITLYLCKTLFMQRVLFAQPRPAVWGIAAGKLVVSGINGVLAVAGCVLLAPVLHSALVKAGFFKARRGGAAGQ